MSSVHESFDYTQQKRTLQSKVKTIQIEPIVKRTKHFADSARLKTTQSDAVQGGESIIFRIPPMRRSFIDQKNTVLKFSAGVYNSFATGTYDTSSPPKEIWDGYYVNIDGCCASFFQSLKVTQGGRLLEYLNEYGQLVSLIMDAGGVELDGRATALNILMGTYMSEVTAGNTTIRGGKTWGIGTTTVSSTEIARNTTTTFAMPIISGILGSLAEKYLPINDLENPIQIEFTLAPFYQCLLFRSQTGGTRTWYEQYHWICDLTLELSVIELSPEVYDAVQRQNNGIYYLPSESYSVHSEMLPDTRQHTLAVPNAHFRGLQKVLITMLHKNSRNASGYNCFGVTGRRLYRLSEVQFRIGNNYYPERPINTNFATSNGIDAYLEVLKCFRNPKGLLFTKNILDAEQFYTTAELPSMSSGGYNSAGRCGGLIGFNFASHEDSNLYNGLDTSDEAAELQIEMKFLGAHENDMCFVFTNYDMTLKFENGRYTVLK